MLRILFRLPNAEDAPLSIHLGWQGYNAAQVFQCVGVFEQFVAQADICRALVMIVLLQYLVLRLTDDEAEVVSGSTEMIYQSL